MVHEVLSPPPLPSPPLPSYLPSPPSSPPLPSPPFPSTLPSLPLPPPLPVVPRNMPMETMNMVRSTPSLLWGVVGSRELAGLVGRWAIGDK